MMSILPCCLCNLGDYVLVPAPVQGRELPFSFFDKMSELPQQTRLRYGHLLPTFGLISKLLGQFIVDDIDADPFGPLLGVLALLA